MNPTLFVSKQLVADYNTRLTGILACAPRKLDILEFTPDVKLNPEQQASIEATFFSRDIWNGTTKLRLSDAAMVYWPIVDAAPNLKWLQVVSAGSDQKPYQTSIGRGIRITTSSGANAEPVGLTAVTGLLMLARNFPHWIRAQQKHEWTPQPVGESPADLPGQTAVIVGMGNIGKVIARALQGMGVRVIGVRRNAAPTEYFDEVRPVSALDELLPKCDWLILACPLTAETRGPIDERRLKLLPRSAGLVNMARGQVIDEEALIRALAGGQLRGAYLDVFSREPLPSDSPLWTLPNVIITPHNSSTGTGNYKRGVEIFLRNLEAYLRGDAVLENEVPRG